MPYNINSTVEEVKEYLNAIFNGRIICRVGDSDEFNIKFDVKENINIKDIAIYIHQQKRIAVIWNLALHRKKNATSNLSLNQKWHNVLPDDKEILSYYKKLFCGANCEYEKVLAIRLDVLMENIDDIYDLLEFAKDDDNIPLKLKSDEKIRERGTYSRIKRDSAFRAKVIKAYNCKCAICRCSEEKILEAAHIKPVCENGTDDVDNGICLCANHHKMFDNGLIKIDINNGTLTEISDTVKEMSWYKQFCEKYNGKIMKRE